MNQDSPPPMQPDSHGQGDNSASAPTRLHHQVDAVIMQLNNILADEPPCPSHSTRYMELNRMMMGLNPAGVTLIASKSPLERFALLFHFTEQICIDGNQPTLLISTEFTSFEIARSLIYARANLEFEDFQQYCPTKTQLKNFVQAAKEVGKSQFFVEDAKDLSMDALQATARRHKEEHGIALIAIDATCMQREHGCAWDLAAIESLAQELNLPILLTTDLMSQVLH